MRFAPARSAAAPGPSHDAPTRPVPNHTAPVEAGSCAAVEPAGAEPRPRHDDGALTPPRDGARGATPPAHDDDDAPRWPPRLRLITNTHRSGGPASGAGIAGMAGPAGAGRPGTFEVPSL